MKFYDFIPDRFLNYGRHFIFDDDKNSVLNALNSGQLTQGNLISKFESIICKYTGANTQWLCQVVQLDFICRAQL